jgi:NAD(P)-dependent dehydrogenase (short-subunit alcohol dehydrogenase family)
MSTTSNLNTNGSTTSLIAVITGGASGIGESVVRRLAMREYFTVVIADLDKAGADRLAHDLQCARDILPKAWPSTYRPKTR